MTLSIYSAQSSEANRLRKGEFEIYYDEEEDKVYIKTGTEDPSDPDSKSREVKFNVIYNKDEVDQLISQGVDPTSFENWIFNAHKVYSFATGNTVSITTLAGLLAYLSSDMQALKILMNMKMNLDAMISYDPETQPVANKVYEALSLYPYLNKMLSLDDMIEWSDDVRHESNSSIYNAQSLWDKITSIVECSCDPDVMAFMTQLYKMSIIQDSGDSSTLPHLYIRSNVHAHGIFTCVNYPLNASYEKRPDVPLTDEEGSESTH